MMERAYCLSCRNEIVTESGHVCAKCAKAPKPQWLKDWENAQ